MDDRTGTLASSRTIARQPPGTADSGCDVACPCCQRPVFRVPRRPVDRLISMFVHVQRYRCSRNWNCGWEGIRRVPGVLPASAYGVHPHDG